MKPSRLWEPVPGAVIDEALPPDVEWALIDLETGEAIVVIRAEEEE